MARRLFVLVLVLVLVLVRRESRTWAAPSGSRLRVRVVDPSGAVVPSASIMLRCAGRAAVRRTSDSSGEARFGDVAAANCALAVEARGFEPWARETVEPDASGVVVAALALARREESLTIAPDSRESLARERSFAQVLTPDEIAALPDDPEEMEDELRRRAGPGAVLRVDGFTGGRLPPKSQIRQIRIQTSRFAAEYHEGGHPGIDIVTKPGLGSWRTSVGGGLRDGAWSARPPLSTSSSAESARRLSLTLDGPLRKEKTSLSLQLQSRDATDVTAVTALVPGAPAVVRPTQRKLDLQGRVEHAWGRTQTARAEVQHDTHDRGELGAGGLALPERAYAEDRAEDFLRLSNTGVVFGSWATDTRMQLRREGLSWRPRTAAPAVDVLGAFSAGGAPLGGRRTTWRVELGQDLSRPVGRHSLRAGVFYEAFRVRAAEQRNTLGTYTFASLDDWNAGRPLLFTRRDGDPRVDVDLQRVGVYAQDDWKPAEALAVNAGLRYEAQSFVGGGGRVAPRVGLTWAARPKLTLRAGGGLFFDWMEAETVAQVRAGDEAHGRELSLDSPGWPDPIAGGVTRVSTARLWALAPALSQPSVWRGSVGLERSLGGMLRLNTEYLYERGEDALRARNLLQPGGSRRFEVRAEGRSRAHTWRTDVMLGGPGHRAGAMVGYLFHVGHNEADGALSLPADESHLSGEWGPAADDIRHRIFGFAHWKIAGRLRASSVVFAQSGAPWDAITGRDDNGDTVANDRPAGVRRNAYRGDWTIDASARLAWDFGFGGARAAGPRGPTMVAVRVGGEDGAPDIGRGPDDQRYGVQLYATAGNLLDHLNPTRYGNVIGSPLFARAVEAGPPRRLEVGLRFRF